MNKNKRIILFAVLFLLVCLLSGCTKEYTLTSNDIYAYGQKLQGPSSGGPSAKLTLSNGRPIDGTTVVFVYAGSTYKGTVKSGFVLWNNDPYIVADSTDMYTLISGDSGKIRLTHNCQIGEYWVEVRQVFEPEKATDNTTIIIIGLAIIAVVIIIVVVSNKKKKNSGAHNLPDSTDEIRKYKELFDQGIISEEEFNEKKKQLLGL